MGLLSRFICCLDFFVDRSRKGPKYCCRNNVVYVDYLIGLCYHALLAYWVPEIPFLFGNWVPEILDFMYWMFDLCYLLHY